MMNTNAKGRKRLYQAGVSKLKKKEPKRGT